MHGVISAGERWEAFAASTRSSALSDAEVSTCTLVWANLAVLGVWADCEHGNERDT